MNIEKLRAQRTAAGRRGDLPGWKQFFLLSTAIAMAGQITEEEVQEVNQSCDYLEEVFAPPQGGDWGEVVAIAVIQREVVNGLFAQQAPPQPLAALEDLRAPNSNGGLPEGVIVAHGPEAAARLMREQMRSQQANGAPPVISAPPTNTIPVRPAVQHGGPAKAADEKRPGQAPKIPPRVGNPKQ